MITKKLKYRRTKEQYRSPLPKMKIRPFSKNCGGSVCRSFKRREKKKAKL